MMKLQSTMFELLSGLMHGKAKSKARAAVCSYRCYLHRHACYGPLTCRVLIAGGHEGVSALVMGRTLSFVNGKYRERVPRCNV